MLPSVNARSTAGINQAKRDYKQSTVLTTAVQLRVTDRVPRAGLITPVTGRPDRPEPCRLLLSLFHFKGEIFKNSFLYWYCKKQIFKAATKVVSYKEQFSIPASTPPEGNAQLPGTHSTDEQKWPMPALGSFPKPDPVISKWSMKHGG